MMEACGKADVEERLKSRNRAEIAAYARWEYGAATSPEFLLANQANGADGKARKRRDAASGGVIRTFVKALNALVPGNGSPQQGKAANVPLVSRSFE